MRSSGFPMNPCRGEKAVITAFDVLCILDKRESRVLPTNPFLEQLFFGESMPVSINKTL